MDKKKIVLVCFIAIVIVISGVFLFISRKKKEPSRDYMLFSVNEYLYYPLKSEGKYGVIKKDGTIIVEPIYDEVQVPNQDKAIFVVKDSGTFKVLNDKQEQIFSGVSEITAIAGRDEYGNTVFNNTVLKYSENNKFGLIGFDGKKITPAVYDEMQSLEDKYGEILVAQNGKYGVINVNGVTLVQLKYDFVKGDGYIEDGSYKDSGYIIGNRTNQGMKYGYIDKNENQIISLDQELLYRVTEINSEDAYLVASQNGRLALFKNKVNLTDYKYIDIFYNNGTDCFTVQKNKSYGLINLLGEIVIPTEYEELLVVGIFVKAHKDNTDYTYDLKGNLALNSDFVSLKETTTGKLYISIDEDYRYGLTDIEKNVVVQNKYDYIDEIEETGLLIATVGDNVTIYSGGGREIISAEHADLKRIGKYIEVTTAKDSYFLSQDGKKVDNKSVYLNNKLYASKSNNKWGFVDLKNNVIVTPIYDEVTEFNEYGFAGVKKNGKWGVINESGEVVLEPTYDSDIINPVFIGRFYKSGNLLTDELGK